MLNPQRATVVRPQRRIQTWFTANFEHLLADCATAAALEPWGRHDAREEQTRPWTKPSSPPGQPG
jgi:hypothetical protein